MSEKSEIAPEKDLLGDLSGRSGKGRWVLGAVVIALLAGLAYQFGMPDSDAAGEASYTTEGIQTRRIAKVVSATGTLSPVTQVQVGTQVSGTIKALHVDFNSEVKAGQVIAEIDPRLFVTAVSQARARLATANARLEQAKTRAEQADLQYGRVKDLKPGQAVSQSEVDTLKAAAITAKADIAVANASVSEAYASLEQAKTNMAYTTSTAPIDGIVVSRNVEVGQTVASSFSAPVLFVIAGNLREMEMHTNVPESDIGQLEMGMEVEFGVDAFSAETFTGQVKQIRFESTTVSNVVTYDAVVAVDNAKLKLRPGMTANATFVVAQLESALAIPNKALRFKLPGKKKAGGKPPPEMANDHKKPAPKDVDGQKMQRTGSAKKVWVLRDGAPVAVAIQVGVTDGSFTELVGGDLKKGDLVITGQGGPKGKRRRGRPTIF